MGNDKAWMDKVQEAAERAGESVWQLPLPDEYRKLIDSEVADVKNIGGGRYAGALTAGLFLKEFVGDVAWAHPTSPARPAARTTRATSPREGPASGSAPSWRRLRATSRRGQEKDRGGSTTGG